MRDMHQEAINGASCQPAAPTVLKTGHEFRTSANTTISSHTYIHTMTALPKMQCQPLNHCTTSLLCNIGCDDGTCSI